MGEPVTVIVGASNGGVATAQALRRTGYTGRIVLLGEETTWPYDKPPLSKAFLAGTATAADISLLTEEDAAKLDIELRLGCCATDLDVAHNVVKLHTGEQVGFDHLVIATGARARPSPWGQRPGVHLLRTLSDAKRLEAALEHGGKLVVIGGGFIGSEVASTARSRGLDVKIIDPVSTLMEQALGRVVGTKFTELHQREGVSTLFGIGVRGMTRRGKRLQIELTDERRIEADTVVVGIGAIPNDQWLQSSGLEVNDGVICDQYCRAVNFPNVFAVGDVARWHNPRYESLCRVEHWTNATEQANVIAHNIACPADLMPYSPVEYVWSDQYDWKLRIAGRTNGASNVAIVGEDSATQRFAALYGHDDGNLAGIALVNWPRALVVGRKALQQGMSYAQLKDTLDQLASKSAAPAGVST